MPAWLDLVAKTSGLLLVAAVLVGLMRRASAASRHLVWTGMFAAVLVLPIMKSALPALPIRVWPSIGSPAPPVPTAVVARDRIEVASETRTVSLGPASPLPLHRADEPVRGAESNPARGLIWMWFTGVAFFLTRIVIGSIGSQRWRSCERRTIDPELLARLEQTRRALHVRRPIALVVSARSWMPVTWGVVRPTILVPSAVADACGECPERFDAVLVHEVAHIARLDALSQFIARVAVAVWWFNPLFWLAARRARLERERACDDAVLAQGARASDYASHLLTLVRTLAPAPIATSATLSMAGPSQLARRVRSILDAGTNRRGRSRASLLLTSALMILMLPVSAVRLAARTPPDEASRVDGAAGAPASGGQSGRARVANRAVVSAARRPNRADKTTATAIDLVPIAPPQTEQTQQAPPAQVATAVDVGLRAERAEMFRQLLDKARRQMRDEVTMVEIGTLASIDITVPEKTLAELEGAAAADRSRSVSPSEAERAAVRRRFAIATANLDAAQTKFSLGLSSPRELDDVFRAALDVLRPATTPASAAATPMSDADVIAALQRAATIASDPARADALLALSGEHALSPEMVGLYVAAANGITSRAERDRVFAQPIRVKGGR